MVLTSSITLKILNLHVIDRHAILTKSKYPSDRWLQSSYSMTLLRYSFLPKEATLLFVQLSAYLMHCKCHNSSVWSKYYPMFQMTPAARSLLCSLYAPRDLFFRSLRILSYDHSNTLLYIGVIVASSGQYPNTGLRLYKNFIIGLSNIVKPYESLLSDHNLEESNV